MLSSRFRYPVLSNPAALFAALLLSSAALPAAVVTHHLSYEFSGAVAPSGPLPWLTAYFDDAAAGLAPGSVRLTMEATNLMPAEKVKEWYFNFNPEFDAALLEFSYVDSEGISFRQGVPGYSVASASDGFRAGGDGHYDLVFGFDKRDFTAGDFVMVDIALPSIVLAAADFDFYSLEATDNGSYTSAAHVLGTGVFAGDSGWIGDPDGGNLFVVPEPSAYALLLALGAMVALAAKRRPS